MTKLAASLSAHLPDPLAQIVGAAEHDARRGAAGFHWDPRRGLRARVPSQPGNDRRSLSLVMTKGGKSLFQSISDDRVKVFWPEDRLTAAPDFVVVTEPYQLVSDPDSLGIAPEVRARLRSGAAKLLIDSSSEGYPFSAVFAGLDSAVQAMGLAPAGYVYVTQDRRFAKDYRRAGRSGAEVFVHDRYLQYVFASIGQEGRRTFRRRILDYAARPAHRSRRFISLNNKFRPARLLFLLGLLKAGLWERGHISMGPFDRFAGHELTSGQITKKTLGIKELRPLAEDLLPLFDQLEALAPQYVGLSGRTPRNGGHRMMVIPQMFSEYADSWFTVVTETDFSNRLHRVTEKPLKPLLCFHPLIVLGSCGSLRLLREYGFRTFPELFDERYDEETDARARFEAVFEQVTKLCAMDEAELGRASEAASEAMVFNAVWGLTELPGLFARRIDAALVDGLIGSAHGRLESA